MLHLTDRINGGVMKGIASVVLYALAIVLAFVNPLIAIAIYVVVALMWLVPDRRIERAVAPAHRSE